MTTDPADGLIDYLAASPSPFHACMTSAALLRDAGFVEVSEADPLPGAGRYYFVRGGSLVAWDSRGAADPAASFRVVGAHTDSPNLRIKPRPDRVSAGFAQLGVEVYGGPLLNSWLDRDLGLSGRVAVRAGAVEGADAERADAEWPAGVDPAPGVDPAGVTTVLVRVDEPILRVPQLAVHLDRSVNTDGVKLNPQQHLSPIWALSATPRDFCAFLAERIGVHAADVLGFDIMTHDVAGPSRIGADREFIASGRLDNLATSYAGTRALIDATAGDPPNRGAVPVLVLFDHEEVGSVSERGAQSVLLPTALERISVARGGSRGDFHRSMAGTVIASGDMAHATHPNYPERHEPNHPIAIGGGPVLKINNQLRYATGAPGAAAFALACQQAGVPMQQFVTRSDLPCGSTVGPVTAARTGAQTVDFGAPMLSMHSARELMGVADVGLYVAALGAFLVPAAG